MPKITQPSNYNMEDLYLYCDLTTRPEIGGKNIDFSGIKTYSVGFLRDGVGFGITSINIDISPSMQPVIDITFKDFYGNLAIEFNRNKDFVDNITDENGDGINYSSLFQLPYPKFKLTFKGYIGNPVAIDLNVKRVDVTFQPNDGSYEIKAVFIPNLYGFFSDIPFYFLKAVSYLKNSGRNNSKDKILTLFDILETSQILVRQQEVVSKSIESTKNKLNILYSNLDSMLDDDFDYFEEIKNTSDSGILIPGMQSPLYLNLGKFVRRNKSPKLSIVDKSSKESKAIKSSIKNSKSKEIYKQLIISSISTTKETDDSKLIYLYDDINKLNVSQLKKGQDLLLNAKKACDDFELSQIKTTNKELLKQVTIETVFDLLVKDSAYLMGRILEAGKQGYITDKSNRDTNNDYIGLYFPVTREPSTDKQIPVKKTGPEFTFVNDFISALSKGLAEEERRGLNESSINTPDNIQSQIKKRISNLEIGSQNPYVLTPTAENIIENLLKRTGLIAHLFFGDIDTDSDDVVDAIDSELSNINEALQKITEIEVAELNAFHLNIKNEINKNGDLIDGNYINDPQKKYYILNKLVNSSDVDSNTLKSKKMENNKIFYYYPTDTDFFRDDYYILFKKSQFKDEFIVSNEENTSLYDDSSFRLFEITDKNLDDVSDISEDDHLIDFEKMQSALKSSSNISIKDILYTPVSDSQQFNSNQDTNGKYFYGKYILDNRDSGYVWDFAGDSDEAQLQRYLLITLTEKILGQIKTNKTEQDKRNQEKEEQLSSNDGYDIIYNQFHNLCNNWKNLVTIEGSKGITEHIVSKFCNSNDEASNIFYDIPLLSIQGKNNINIRNAIVNVDALRNSNEQSSVLNAMSNICVKNNFMFLAIPGMADNNSSKEDNKIIYEKSLSELLKPNTKYINYDSIEPFNHFYVLWMPTPENRAQFNNGNYVYSDFDPSQISISQNNIFQIDYGSSENTVFKSINMSTEDNKMTSESAIAINSIADPQNSKKYKSFDCSALSVMEGRSYKITVEMIGNAQIKPTQFFVLNSTHIFSGLYQIMKVSHSIRPNDMTTKFEAIKMKYTGNNNFVFIPPITIDDVNDKNLIPTTNVVVNDDTEVDLTDYDGFPVSQSTISNYVGKITHSSIPIPNRAILDTVSFLDNGNITKNNGYDVLVGYNPKNKNERIIPGWTDSYAGGMDFDAWKLRVNSPTKGKVVTTSASGRYQIVYTTWRDSSQLIDTEFTGVVTDPKNPPFNKDNQDIVANFLLTSRLKKAGLTSSDIEKAYLDIKKFDIILRALQEEWESVKLLRINGKFIPKGMSVKDVYDFFVYAYNQYK